MDISAYNSLPERIHQADELIRCCRICPRNCGVDRTALQKGYCGLDDSVRFIRELVFNEQEKELNPSHQIYFAGCNLRCEYCAVAEWNEQPEAAKPVDIMTLSRIINQRRRDGAKTLNLLGGEPSVNIHGILRLLEQLDPDICVTWNSNMYYNSVVSDLLEGLVDIYIADFKCGNDCCANVMLGVDDYVSVVQKNILRASRNAKVIIRLLEIPGHEMCCREPIRSWMAENLPDAKISLQKNYAPPFSALNQKDTVRTFKKKVPGVFEIRIAGDGQLTMIGPDEDLVAIARKMQDTKVRQQYHLENM